MQESGTYLVREHVEPHSWRQAKKLVYVWLIEWGEDALFSPFYSSRRTQTQQDLLQHIR